MTFERLGDELGEAEVRRVECFHSLRQNALDRRARETEHR
jgi:hypothetical protein